jgi:hypothetical protein
LTDHLSTPHARPAVGGGVGAPGTPTDDPSLPPQAVRLASNAVMPAIRDFSATSCRYTDVDMFGRKSSRGRLVITQVLNGHAAYRTQLFL